MNNQILALTNKQHVDRQIIEKFIQRIRNGKLTKSENETDHLCVFFLPIHRTTQSIYLGHHLKADDWIPPGGHIEIGEMPDQALIREFKEELACEFKPAFQFELFDLTVKQINNPRHNCKIHWDIWYIVLTDKINFIYNKVEFKEAVWLDINKAIKRIKRNDNYKKTIEKIPQLIF